jgi:endo-1,4-beta-xylanase
MRAPLPLFPALALAVCAVAGARGDSLREAYAGLFKMGVAVNAAEFSERSPVENGIILSQFNSVTPENALKWERVHPKPGYYDFSLPDLYVAFAERHHLWAVGHVLVWHEMTPAWVFRDGAGEPISREGLVARMREHILTVVGRYSGRIASWDVVNEAFNDDGTWRESPWYRTIGKDYVRLAFQFAHEADPAAVLNYNDFNLEKPAKRAAVVALIRELRAEGIPVAVVGNQAHYRIDYPDPADVDATIKAFAAVGVKMAFTELDMDVLPKASPPASGVAPDVPAPAALNPYPDGMDVDAAAALTRRYEALFRVFASNHRAVDRVTFWCVTDASSWLNDWPVRHRTAYPLLFNRDGTAKPALEAVLAIGVSAPRD